MCACVCEELCPSQAHRTGEKFLSVCVCVAGTGLPVQSWAVIAAGRLCLAAPPHPLPPTTLPCHHPSPAHMPTCPPLPCLQPSAPYVAPEDLRPLLAGILLSHPGLEFLHEAPEFQER